MKPDPKKETLRWLTQAEEELKDAELLAKEKRFYLSLYLCQQSAEKALKAYLYLKEEEPIFTHSVSVLLRMAATIDGEFHTIDTAKRLDDYYIPTRYPNGLPGGIPAQYYDDEEEAERALELCRKVVQLVKRKIAEENS
jgi:HEPN domain-containing protein